MQNVNASREVNEHKAGVVRFTEVSEQPLSSGGKRDSPILWRLGPLTGDKPVDREQGVAGIFIIHLLPPLRNRQDAYFEIKEWLTFCGHHPPLCLLSGSG